MDNNQRIVFEIFNKQYINKQKTKQEQKHLLTIFSSLNEVPDKIKTSISEESYKFDSCLVKCKKKLRNTNYLIWFCLAVICFVSTIVAMTIEFLSSYLITLRMDWVGDSFIKLAFTSILSASLATHLCAKFSNSAEGSGIPELKSVFSGINYYKFLDMKTFWVKFFGVIFVKVAGYSIGFEAAFVHLVAIIGENVSSLPFFKEVFGYKL